MKSKSSLSIVIPVYNEEQRLSITFGALDEFLERGLFADMDVVFVNDGSTDETSEILKSYKPTVPVKVMEYNRNRGKGYAVTTGMLATTGDYALMTDADMSTPFDQIERFLPYLEEGKEVLVGNRRIPGSHLEKTQPWIRRSMGRCYTILANIITGVPVSDFTCGFKIFSKEARQKVFTRTKIERWSYDTEILYLAYRAGYPIVEVPVRWINDEGTRVNLWKDTVRSFVDLFRISFGKYD